MLLVHYNNGKEGETLVTFDENSPIYMQIIQRIKADIVSGALPSGSRMPSVREMSEQFRVNPNTIQRVFLELEREGITFSQRGIGTFISEDVGLIEKLMQTQAEKYTRRFIREMTGLGMTKKDIDASIRKVMEEIENDSA